MILSDNGLEFIKAQEGFRNTPYPDAGGYSIGYGHYLGKTATIDYVDQAQATDLLNKDVQQAVDAVNQSVAVDITQSMFDALVSLAYNWGAGHFKNSLLVKKLNASDYNGAAERLRQWPITSQGQVVQALVRRRAQEAELFLQDGLPDGTMSVASNLPDTPEPDASKKDASNLSSYLLIAAIALIAVIVLKDI